VRRVVLDTNVYIFSADVWRPALLDLAFLKSFDTIVSPALLDELDDKLRLKFKVPEEDTAMIRARIESIADLVEPEETLRVIEEDPDYNRVLECAVTGRANHIVSGDRHLVRLGSFRGIPIMRVRQFLDVIEPKRNE
jgi:uncharacterized protein